MRISGLLPLLAPVLAPIDRTQILILTLSTPHGFVRISPARIVLGGKGWQHTTNSLSPPVTGRCPVHRVMSQMTAFSKVESGRVVYDDGERVLLR